MEKNPKLVSSAKNVAIANIISACIAFVTLFIPLTTSVFGYKYYSVTMFSYVVEFLENIDTFGGEYWTFAFFALAVAIFTDALVSLISAIKVLATAKTKGVSLPKNSAMGNFFTGLIVFILIVMYIMIEGGAVASVALFVPFGFTNVWLFPCLQIAPMAVASHFVGNYNKEKNMEYAARVQKERSADYQPMGGNPQYGI